MQSLPCSFSIPFHSLSFDLARNLMGNAPCGQSPCPLPQTYARRTLSTLQGFYFSSFFCIFNAFCFASLSPFVCRSHVSLHKGAAAITCLAKCVRVSEVCVSVCACNNDWKVSLCSCVQKFSACSRHYPSSRTPAAVNIWQEAKRPQKPKPMPTPPQRPIYITKLHAEGPLNN